GIVRFQSFDEGETWETAPAEPPVTDLDGSLFGRFPPDLHALLATSDGTIFGYAEETFYSNPDCFRGEVRAVSSDDGGASWQAFADDPMTWPVALTLDEDLVTAEYVRGEERVLLRRLEWEARRWRLIGEPTLDGEPIYRAGFA